MSPDESQIALLRGSGIVRSVFTVGDIWLLDRARNNLEQRLTTGESVQVAAPYGPVWPPDGKHLAYAYGTRLYLKDVGGAADAKLIKDVGKPAIVSDWTRDGFLVYTTGPSVTDIFSIPVRSGDPASAGTPEGTSYTGRVSPDGRWLAYGSSRSGRTEVYVRPISAPGSGAPPSGPVIQVSANGGLFPKWRADGKELFFLESVGGSIMSAASRRPTAYSVPPRQFH